MNAVAGATGLARPFGNVNTNPNSAGYGTLGHDGPHVVAPAGSLVTTLPALTGTVIDIHTGGSPGIPEKTKIVDVLLDNGNIAIYKDLVPGTIRVAPRQRVSAGSLIGAVGGGENMGLHFALLKGGMREHDAYRAITSGRKKNPITTDMFINPLGPNSPVNCPGVRVNNAGVIPHP